jgi:hypothetical protein
MTLCNHYNITKPNNNNTVILLPCATVIYDCITRANELLLTGVIWARNPM